MSTIIEARRLNGTDIGKTVEFLNLIKGTLASVHHQVCKFEETKLGDSEPKSVEFQVIEIQLKDRDEQWTLYPSTKVTISGKESKP
ncbi:hypothetical protein [Glutamicibacter ardleyensis]|uniref:hypothetical protein n=1 Tax=Glutamicibacter ardleyensis TaxID=225894 RepID=UPI003FD66082